MRLALLTFLVTLMTATPVAAAELPAPLLEQIAVVAEQGDAEFADGNYAGAIGRYQSALRLLPEPIAQWELRSALMVAIGDTHFAAGEFGKALQALELSMGCAGGSWNPFAQLRLGQAALELGECERAANALSQALVQAGYDIFEGEHPKYLDFAANVLSLERSGRLGSC
jgi:tetratricopeptide (TPR) repeat protein